MATASGHPDGWRRPACGDGCRRERVIVVLRSTGRVGAEWREYHDADQHDRHTAGLSIALSACLSRGRSGPGAIVRTGPLTVDLARKLALVNGIARHLTPIEWDILAHLARSLDELCSGDELAARVWPDDLARAGVGVGLALDPIRALRVNLSRLRPKLGPARHLIENRPCVGWRLRAEPPAGLDGGAS